MRNPYPSFLARLQLAALWRAGLTAIAVAALMAACGGGVGSGGTGGFASGPITGFGSVIVNGVHFDDSSADISDADGSRRSRDELRLGMTVEVESGAIANNSAGVAAAVASRIRVESELRGPVTAVQASAGTFTMLGQPVAVSNTTLFGDGLPHGLASLTGPGAPPAVEVYAVFDASGGQGQGQGQYRALRVDAAAATATLRVRGPVQQIDTAGQSVRIGAATYGLSALTQPPTGLGVGQIVRLQLQPTGAGPALSVKGWGSTVQPVGDTDVVRLRGVVSAYSSLASFSIDGRAVDATGASVSPSGAMLAVGARVDVEGPVRNGVLRASKLALSNDSEDYDRGFELSGTITAVTPTATPGQPLLVLRGQTVSTSRADLRYDNGTAALLTVGRNIEVKGQLAADRRTVEATRITFK